ncbi:polysaccharide lyase family protein [uncultured Alistipes sp.]|uniref:glycoside hydrolase family 38 N-terminal domain-containing protein n=1 Tax=uncultured Alistipes sp. TaxID=538949 RepID=UPI0026193D8D|nr:polysaccharide lyase family protein [uncultured Alistipes sp.]
MKHRRLAILSILMCLAGTALGARPYPAQVWQIGKTDNSSAEFALDKQGYSALPEHFPAGVALYTVGRSASTDIPFVIPGPADSWAGNVQGGLLIRFAVKQADPAAALRLAFDFVEVHSASAPRIEVSLNGFRTEVQTPAGADQNYLDTRKTPSKGLSAEVEIPAGTLRTGDNILSIRSVAGSWMVLDALRLEASAPVATTAPKGGVTLFSAISEPALIYGTTPDEQLHPVVLNVANWDAKPRKATWSYDGKPGGELRLAPGMNSLQVGIPEGYDGRKVRFALEASGNRQSLDAEILPAERWTIYLVQHTHTDIGYTKPQTEILTEHLRYIDYAVEYCEATENYPDDAKFRWTCEASWAVREWLRIRPQEQIDKFLHYVKNGQIEVTAMFFNMSELSGENAYKTFLEPIAGFHKLGIPVQTAMQDDVNGVAWCLADYLPDLGVKYLTMGSNGHRALIPFDRPTLYRWESPSGKSLLSFRADHYMTANFWGIDRGDMEGVRNGVFSYIRTLRSRGYDFPLITAQYSGYSTDNSPPSMQECALIRDWNDHYAWPKLRSATVHEFLEQIDTKYGDRLPVYRAAYPDWWTDGFGSAARETAASRKTQSDMITIAGMLSMASLAGDPGVPGTLDELRRIHENLLFYDEHTFGAAESISDPLCENSQVQWAEKGSYAWEALKSAQMLYETSIGRLQGELHRAERPTLTFFNPLGWERSAMTTVYIDFEVIPRDRAFRLLDEQGHALRVQPLRSRREGRYYAIWAERIPAMGYKTYEIVLDEGKAAEPQSFEMEEHAVENAFYRMTFDAATGGIRSLVDKELGLELVDAGAEWKLGDFIYESLEGDRHQMERKVFERFHRTGLRNVRFTGAKRGAIYTSVTLRGEADGCEPDFGVRIEVRLYNDIKRIEFHYAARRLPETDPSGLYVAFPFALEGGRLAFDVPGGVVYAGENQIPGTSASWNTVQNFVSVRNDRAQILVSCDAIPLFMMGELLNDPYRQPRLYEKPHLFSWVTNNYWTTNFRASQEGELNWSYAITSQADTSNAEASAFGWGNRVPLYARVMPAARADNGKAWSRSFLSTGCDHVLMTSCVPSKAEEGAVLINLRETDGRDATLTLLNADGQPLPFERVNVLDEVQGEKVTSLPLKGYENVFVRVRL